ncbi:hypothetical protein D3C83_128320 [compost metagenome]
MWGKFALKSSIDSRVNEGEMIDIKPGQEGVALSALRPVGKAEIGNRTYEVRTNGEYVESGTRIKILKVISHQIIVEPLT